MSETGSAEWANEKKNEIKSGNAGKISEYLRLAKACQSRMNGYIDLQDDLFSNDSGAKRMYNEACDRINAWIRENPDVVKEFNLEKDFKGLHGMSDLGDSLGKSNKAIQSGNAAHTINEGVTEHDKNIDKYIDSMEGVEEIAEEKEKSIIEHEAFRKLKDSESFKEAEGRLSEQSGFGYTKEDKEQLKKDYAHISESESATVLDQIQGYVGKVGGGQVESILSKEIKKKSVDREIGFNLAMEAEAYNKKREAQDKAGAMGIQGEEQEISQDRAIYGAVKSTELADLARRESTMTTSMSSKEGDFDWEDAMDSQTAYNISKTNRKKKKKKKDDESTLASGDN